MRIARTRGRTPLSAVLGLALVSASIAGCSEVDQVKSMVGLGNDLTVASDDPCGQERATFARSNDFFTADVLKSAGIGALIGGAGGAAIGGALGGGRGAAVGGVLGILGGAVTSLTISYTQYMQQQYGSNPGRMAEGINADLTTESRARDRTIANFRSLQACRFARAASIRRDARLGHISHPEAQHELDAQHTWFNQEIAVAQHWGINMQKRDEQFQDATNNLARSQGQTSQTRKAVVAATETNPDKRQVLASQVGTAQRESQVAFNLDTRTSWIWFLSYA